MSNAARGGGSAHPGKNYQQWPKGTQWAFFKHIPDEVGGPGTPNHAGHGWVRVGSKLWGEIKFYNTHATGLHGGRNPGGVGGGARLSIHPSRKATQRWNPGSPRGQIILQGGGTVGSDPGRGGEQAARAHPTKNNGGIPSSPGGMRNPGNRTGGNQRRTNNQRANDRTVSKGLGSPNNQQLQNPNVAATLAGLQYDAQIHDAQVQRADQHAQGAQDMADIANWYDHIQQLGQQVQDRNHAQVAQSSGALDQTTQSLMNMIGGAGNQSAGQVAAQGGADAASMRQLGLVQDQFSGNMKQAMAGQEAAQASAQQALNSQQAQGISQTIQDLLGQRGQAVVQNGQTILAFNNAARQSNYNNRIAKLQAVIGANVALGNQRLQEFQVHQAAQNNPNRFIPFWHQSTAQKVETIKQLVAGGANGGLIPEAQALARAKQMGYDPTTVRPFLNTYYGK